MNINVASLGINNNSNKINEETISRNSLVIEIVNPTRGLTLLKDFLEAGEHKTTFRADGSVYVVGNLKLNHHNIKTLLIAGPLIIDLPLSNDKIHINRMEDYISQYDLLSDYVKERREVS